MIPLLEKLYYSKLWLFYAKLTNLATHHAFPLLVFLIRIQIAQIFWYSGLTKISSMTATIYLFEYEYKVPFVSPEIAAYLSAATEISMPLFLVIGLFTRLAALPLLFMTAVIEFTYLQLPEHIYWAFLLGVIIVYGPGKFSLDHLLDRLLKKLSKI